MANETIRKEAKKNRVAHWEIAENLGINESVFSRKMRHELPKKQADEILSIIRQLSVLKKKED